MIEVRELTKRYPLPTGQALLAVDHISFNVKEGEVYGLLGPNGAGKTTTLRMLLGLLTPTSGSAVIAGYDSSREPEEVKRRVGLVAANAGIYQFQTAREMLLFFADLYGIAPADAKVRLVDLVKLLNIEQFLDQPCASLSTGQRQRVNFARALIHDPDVMLLDEPTLGLDVIGSQVVMEFIHHLRETGKSVILCTHHLDEAERICSRFGLLNRGRIVIEGTLDDLREKTGCKSLVEIFMGLVNLQPVLQSSKVIPA